MTRYEVIVEALQEMIDNDYITLEDAEIINDLAYERYSEELVDESTGLSRHINRKMKDFDKISEKKIEKLMIKCTQNILK